MQTLRTSSVIMNISLFRLALERLQSSDWQYFEQLSSAFLAPEFDKLRTMAHPTGDGGRDSELFTPDSKPLIAFQYSVQERWREKIAATVARLTKEFPSVRMLVYLSNQQIGGQADDIKRRLLDQNISLDVRDRSWFLERADLGESRQNAAEQLIECIARPYLVGEQIINKPSSALTSQEARAALLYLGLQWQDDITEKGLTKLSFDALVRAALRQTHSANRMTRRQVHETIQQYMPSGDQSRVAQQVDSALNRLTKRYIRHWQKEDEFCLTHEEHNRILARLAEKENEEASFYGEVTMSCRLCVQGVPEATEEDIVDLLNRVPRVIEKLLLRRGEAFVSGVMHGTLNRIGFEQLTDIVMGDLSTHYYRGKVGQHIPRVLSTAVQSLLAEPKESTQRYLRRLADSYTLFSFLRETPDVQSATRKLFSHGTVWLDTTVLLPVFAELLDTDETLRRFTHLFHSCSSAGIELRVTPGVILEITTHMNTALACSQWTAGPWRGRVPYIYYQYLLHTGKPRQEFAKWLSLFRGPERPEEDIAQYLLDVLGIQRLSLSEEVNRVDEELRLAAERLWTQAHRDRRRQHIEEGDDFATGQLIKHDLETYLGVIALRRQEQVSELGYRHWLLTLDSIAWQIRDKLRSEFQGRTPPSPLLSVDFLVNNLTFGPERHRLTRIEEQTLPIVLDVEMSESMPQDILEIAENVRRDNDGLPEYVIRRRVRDAIDQARRRRACLGAGGVTDRPAQV